MDGAIFTSGDNTVASTETKINACRPGFGASCALCCGSHNCAASPGEMDAMYRSRGDVIRLYSRDYLVKRVMESRSPMTGSYYFTGRRDIGLPELPQLVEAGRCPFIGIRTGTGEIGCLLHEGPEPSLRYECFKNYSSKNFTCAAKEALSDEEVLFAARLCGDWYYYSLLVFYRHDLVSLMREYPLAADVPEPVFEKVKAGLCARAVTDPAPHRMLSYF